MAQESPGPSASNGSDEADTTAPQQAGKAKKSRPAKFLPTDRIAPQKQLDILRAWAAASGGTGKVVTNADVASIVGLSASTISLANPFFVENGLLQKTEAGFMPAAEVVAFGRAFEWNPETAAHKLGPLIQQSWFAQAVMPTLGFRVMDEREAVQAFADAVSAGPDYKDQLETLLFFMNATGVVQHEGGQVRQARISGASSAPAERPTQSAPEPREPTPTSKGAISTAFVQPTEGVVQFHVSVKVDMNEFASWRPDRITAFFGGIAAVLRAKGKVEEDASDT